MKKEDGDFPKRRKFNFVKMHNKGFKEENN